MATWHQIRWDPPNLAAWENSRVAMLEITCRYVVLHLNLKRLGFKGETVTGRRRQSRVNVDHVRM